LAVHTAIAWDYQPIVDFAFSGESGASVSEPSASSRHVATAPLLDVSVWPWKRRSQDEGEGRQVASQVKSTYLLPPDLDLGAINRTALKHLL